MWGWLRKTAAHPICRRRKRNWTGCVPIKRGGNRGFCTKLEKEALELLNSQSQDIDRYEVIAKQLEDKLQILSDIDEEILGLCEVSEIENEVHESSTITDRMLNIKQKIDKETHKPAVSNHDNAANTSFNSTTTATPSTPRLPKLELPKFKGNVTEWISFWDSYDSAIHSNDTISNINKFNYLHSLLEGNAARSIQGLTLTSANYVAAIQILHERFGKPQQIISAHMDEILKIQACTSERTGPLRYVYDKVSVHVRGLASLGVSPDQYGSLLIPIIMSKLPNEVRLQIARKNTNDVWKIEELLNIIKIEVDARETSEGIRTTRQPDNNYRGSSRNGAATPTPTTGAFLTRNKDEAFNIKCIYCEGSHYSASCERTTDSDARKEILRNSGRCFTCLRKGHQQSSCTNTKKCRYCAGAHHQSICTKKPSDQRKKDETPNETSSAANNFCASTTTVTRASKGNVLLQTARAVASNGEKSARVRLLFDTGSQRTYVTNSVARKLDLTTNKKETLHLNTFGHSTYKRQSCEVFKFYVSNRSGTEEVELTAINFPTICSSLKSKVNVDNYPHLQDLDLADFNDTTDDNDNAIDILIGADHYWDFVTDDVVRGEGGPTAISSKLGYLLSGRAAQISAEGTVSNLILTGDCMDGSSSITDNDELTLSLKRFWETESIGIESVEKAEIPAGRKFIPDISFTGERYEVGLPWKEEYPEIGNDYNLCSNRLRSLHRKLRREPELMKEYNKAISDQIKAGIIEKVTTENKKQDAHYLPHHGVVKKDRSTTKLRVVYDGSATTSTRAHSLNDCLETGPNYIPQIFDMLVKFRANPIALVADNENAFLMVGITEKDRDMLRFLWFENVKDRNPDIMELRFCRLVFGLRPSPAILGATITHHLDSCKNPEIAERLKNSLYVDDFISGADNEEIAFQVYKDAKETMATGGFNLRKWNSNSTALVQAINDNEKNRSSKPSNDEDLSFAKSSIAPESNATGDTQVKILGVIWDTTTDTFLFSLANLIEYAKSLPVTKRSLLKWSSKIFDPLGFLTPFTIKLKVMFQELCVRDDLDWDQELSEDARKQWNSLIAELSALNEVRVPRCYYNAGKPIEVQIHGFSDASERAYAAVVYLRTTYEHGLVEVNLIASKTRVAPVKGQTIPRLELLGATILARLVNTIRKTLSLDVTRTFYWVDSMVTLHWIRNNKSWKQYVQNRVNEIRSLSAVTDWRFCPGQFNPADLPSRGISGSELARESSWFQGPSFLLQEENKWPTGKASTTSEINIEAQCEIVKQPSNVVYALVNANEVSESLLDLNEIIDSERFGSLNKFLRVTALVLRFIDKLKSPKRTKSSEKPTKNRELLSSTEIENAELLWIKSVQQSSFTKEIEFLKAGKRDSPTPVHVKNFGLFLDDRGVLKCNGRINNASLDLGSRNPIILPSRHRFVELVIRNTHGKVMHSGIRDTLTTIRERFWVLRGREAVKRIIKKCVICRKAEGVSYGAVAPPDLPAIRVSDDPPFTNVGLDFAGPLYVRERKEGNSEESTSKVYVLLFTCASTRAVHLELTATLNVQSFLRAFRRFSSRRGLPAVLISDNAKTFRSSCKEIKQLCRAEEVRRYLTDNRIQWNFIVERAPWWGGFWERLVRSVKRPLKKVIGRANLTYDELQTLVVEVESLVNARPITFVYDDVESVSYPLTPSHLIYGRRVTTMPNSEHFEVISTYKSLTKKAKHHRHLLESFTKQWRTEYLTSLREQASSKAKNTRGLEIAKGDMVIMRNDSTKRSFWKLAKVEELLTGEDGQTRAAVVRVRRNNSNSTVLLRRSILHLIPIEVKVCDEDERATAINAQQPAFEIPNSTRPQRQAAIAGQLRRMNNRFL